MPTTRPFVLAVAAVSFINLGLQGASAAPQGDHFGNTRVAASFVNSRIASQARRIAHYRATGRLNWVEARHAQFELSHIRGFRANYLRDGWLNRHEAQHLDVLLHTNARRIDRFVARNIKVQASSRFGRRDLSRLNGFLPGTAD